MLPEGPDSSSEEPKSPAASAKSHPLLLQSVSASLSLITLQPLLQGGISCAIPPCLHAMMGKAVVEALQGD